MVISCDIILPSRGHIFYAIIHEFKQTLFLLQEVAENNNANIQHTHERMMNIIIDGYNLLKQLLTREMVLEKERAWFFNLARAYAKKKRHSLFIIYDGGPYERPTTDQKGQVTVIFSGRKESADDVIKSIIEDQVLRNVLLVSTDRQLNAHAAGYDVPSLDSLDFYEFMKVRKPDVTGFKKAPGTAQKLHEGNGSTELDLLMQEGASVLLYKEENEAVPKGASKKRSKKDKATEALLRKL